MATSKILHLIETSGPGGAENMLINNVLELQRRGVEGHVLLLKEGWVHRRLQTLGIPSFVAPIGRFLSPAWLRQVNALIRRGNYQALHSHEFAMNCHVAVLAAWQRLPAVATVHGKNYYGDRIHRRMLYRAMSHVSKVVAVSDDIAKYLASRVGIAPERITVIANGIDIQKHRAQPEIRNAVRSELGIGEDEVLIGAVGNLYPVKGHIHLVHAAAKIVATRPHVRFIVAGRGGEQARLEQEIARLGLAANFRLLGFRDDVDRLLQGFDIFVMPSLSEGLPLSILEAMATQRAVVASSVGGIPELVTSGGNGVLVQPGDVQSLVAGLEKAIDDPVFRQTIALAGYRDVCQKYSQETCTTAYLPLYRLP